MANRKNFSFYAPEDLGDKIDQARNNDERLRPLSRSQAIYVIMTEIQQNGSYKPKPAAGESDTEKE